MSSAHRIGETEGYAQNSEAAYERLSAYAFARRYVGGKAVADIVIGRRGEAGHASPGALLLAQSAESVVVLLGGGSPRSAQPASAGASGARPGAPDVVYRGVELPELPYPQGHFDVVVAFGVLEDLERPEELLREVKRVLKKEGGVLLLSAPDKRADADDGRHQRRGGTGGPRGGMYAAELRELVGRHFEAVRLYRQGAVAGGFVFPDTEQEDGAADGEATGGAAVTVEVARFSSTGPAVARLGAQSPRTRSIIAVCGPDGAQTPGEAPGQEGEGQGGGRAYLLLDHDRGVFEESEERAEDVELMLGEVQQMQESEVQAFIEAMRAQRQQNLAQLQLRYLFHLRSYVGHRRNLILEEIVHGRNIIYGNVDALRKKGVKGSVRGALRRSAALYRRLAAKDGNPN